MFGQPILEAGNGLSLEDTADNKELYVVYGNFLLLIFS